MKKQYFFLVKTKNKQTQEVPETDLIIVRKDKYRIFDYYENNSAGLWWLWINSNSLNHWEPKDTGTLQRIDSDLILAK